MPDVSVVLECADLDAALTGYTDELGFRIDTIFPADAPRVATVSAAGVRITLVRDVAVEEHSSPPTLIVTTPDEQQFSTGRAGMQYRDLIPGRYGGRFIASHIRIPAGGPVPDYVHHHDVEFQMIFCVNGWVRVVYEDQGDSMLMQAGDCFLQPPHIRHRVLECSDAMEVVEITCPAEHETAVDHAMTLPNGTENTNRSFGGQRFVFFEARKSPLLSDQAGGMYRDTGIKSATNGVVSAIVRQAGKGTPIDLAHQGELVFVYVLAGAATFASEETYRLSPGYAAAIPRGAAAELRDLSGDFEFLQVSVPSP